MRGLATKLKEHFPEGKIHESQVLEIEQNCCPRSDSRMMMVSANTLCCLFEVPGLPVPGCTTARAVDARKKHIALESDRQIMTLIEKGNSSITHHHNVRPEEF